MSQSKWAAIVYSRTYEVDFRFIAMPKGFTEKDKKWAEKYILGTTRLPEKLPEQLRWSLFKNERYCVVGVTCMLREIITNDGDENVSEKTQDNGNRPVYGFLGYVTELTKDSELEIPAMNLELFQQLYKYVADRWYVKSFDSASRIPDESQYELDFKATDIAVREEKYFALNNSDKRVNLYPSSDVQDLWFEASRCLYPISLCLGIAGKKDAIDGPFLNATVPDVMEVCTKEKQNQPRMNISHSEYEQRQYKSEYSQNQNIQDDDWGEVFEDDDWGEEESEKIHPSNRDKIAEFFNNPLDFVAAEIKELGGFPSNSNPLESNSGNLSNSEYIQIDSNPEYYQDRDGEIKNIKRDINPSTKRSRSSKQPESLNDTSFGLVEKQESKEKETQQNQESTDSSSKDNDWF